MEAHDAMGRKQREQCRTVDTRRLKRLAGRVSAATMTKVSDVVRMLLGL